MCVHNDYAAIIVTDYCTVTYSHSYQIFLLSHLSVYEFAVCILGKKFFTTKVLCAVSVLSRLRQGRKIFDF